MTSRASSRSIRRATVTPRRFRIACGAAFASLVIIVMTGALVRLTGSGLGCSDWPRCNESKFVDVSSGHTAIEQLNRLFTGVVSASVIAAVLLAHRLEQKRRDLVLLAWGLVIGVLAQIVIGGIVVLTGLHPLSNMAHFLVSMVLVAIAYVLWVRSDCHPQDRWIRPVPDDVRWLHRVLMFAIPVAIVTGTVVTATGPHAGDENAPRFGFDLSAVARVHGSSVVLVLVALVIASWKLRVVLSSDRDSVRYRDVFTSLLLVACAQAAVGWTQYFTGVPVFLVTIHIAGATAFWLTWCAVWFEGHRRRADEGDAAGTDSMASASVS